jgi:hypothetical protein
MISPSQGRYLYTEQHKHRIHAQRHPYLERDLNTRPQRSNGRRAHALDRMATVNVHEDVWGSGSTAPRFLTSAVGGGERRTSSPRWIKNPHKAAVSLCLIYWMNCYLILKLKQRSTVTVSSSWKDANAASVSGACYSIIKFPQANVPELITTVKHSTSALLSSTVYKRISAL